MKTPGSRKCSVRRMRSPSSAPFVNGEDGSIERTATWRSSARRFFSSQRAPLAGEAYTIGLTGGRENVWNSDKSFGQLLDQNIDENREIMRDAEAFREGCLEERREILKVRARRDLERDEREAAVGGVARVHLRGRLPLDEERQLRKRRLIKGPKEFQDLRRNRPKANQ